MVVLGLLLLLLLKADSDPKAFQSLLKQGLVLEAVNEGMQDVVRVNSSRTAKLALKLSLWRSVAKAARMARFHETALQLHSDILNWHKLDGDANDVLKACFELATDHFRLGQAMDGLTVLDDCQAHLRVGQTKLEQGLFHRIRALAFDCAGDFKSALRESRLGVVWDVLEPFPLAAQTQELSRHLLYLQRAANVFAGPLESDLSQAHQEEIASTRAHLVALGGYKHPYQVPQNYEPSLPAVAWPTLETYPVLHRLAQALTASTVALQQEGEALYAQGHLFQDEHCIPAKQRGAWSRFEASGVWEDRDSHGCSQSSPVLCQVIHQALQQDPALVVTRASYSHVQPNTWIQPHYGGSNKRLKLHLGLTIPPSNSNDAAVPNQFVADQHPSCLDKCAYFRLGKGSNSVRCWSNSTVLLLDDSFEHEVYNACQHSRLILQVVVQHPLLPSSRQSDRLPPVTTS
eukprot:m.192712 g.192712  ORF g.192712 m.192712 type:complete len:459 (+) comp16967_c0_seq3:184-1560(+)